LAFAAAKIHLRDAQFLIEDAGHQEEGSIYSASGKPFEKQSNLWPAFAEISELPVSCCNATVFLCHFCYRLQFFGDRTREAFLVASGIPYAAIAHKLKRVQSGGEKP